MVVTLPVAMILLDYWPLKRFESKKGNLIMWQLKEKILFFLLSATLVIITFYAPDNSNAMDNPDLTYLPLLHRLANAPVAFVTYLEKTFRPHDLAIFYPFTQHIPLGQVLAASLLIITISAIVIAMAKRQPHLFVGWLWYAITIAPVIGIIQISLSAPYIIADRYHYLPSIGIAIILAWGIPSLIKNENIRKNILLPSAIIFLGVMGFLSWKQCGYWKNSIELWNHALHVTINNTIAHNNRGAVYDELGQYELAIEDYSEVINLQPVNFLTCYNRGNIYSKLNRYQNAIADYNESIRLKPDYADAYYNRGVSFLRLGQYQSALPDFNKAIHLKPDFADAYNNRGGTFLKLGQYQPAMLDFNKAIHLKPDYADAYNNRGGTFFKLGQYQLALVDFNKAISLKQDYPDAYKNRNLVYLKLRIKESSCYDAKKQVNQKTVEH
jgi:tetratricopeptide (TPR) repeat protein